MKTYFDLNWALYVNGTKMSVPFSVKEGGKWKSYTSINSKSEALLLRDLLGKTISKHKTKAAAKQALRKRPKYLWKNHFICKNGRMWVVKHLLNWSLKATKTKRYDLVEEAEQANIPIEVMQAYVKQVVRDKDSFACSGKNLAIKVPEYELAYDWKPWKSEKRTYNPTKVPSRKRFVSQCKNDWQNKEVLKTIENVSKIKTDRSTHEIVAQICDSSGVSKSRINKMTTRHKNTVGRYAALLGK